MILMLRTLRWVKETQPVMVFEDSTGCGRQCDSDSTDKEREGNYKDKWS